MDSAVAVMLLERVNALEALLGPDVQVVDGVRVCRRLAGKDGAECAQYLVELYVPLLPTALLDAAVAAGAVTRDEVDEMNGVDDIATMMRSLVAPSGKEQLGFRVLRAFADFSGFLSGAARVRVVDVNQAQPAKAANRCVVGFWAVYPAMTPLDDVVIGVRTRLAAYGMSPRAATVYPVCMFVGVNVLEPAFHVLECSRPTTMQTVFQQMLPGIKYALDTAADGTTSAAAFATNQWLAAAEAMCIDCAACPLVVSNALCAAQHAKCMMRQQQRAAAAKNAAVPSIGQTVTNP
jgi:hypothetical protein